MFTLIRGFRIASAPRPAAATALAATLLAVCGCGPRGSGRLEVWVGEDLYGGPGTLADGAFDPTELGYERDVTLAGAINETLGVSLSITVGRSSVRGLTVKPSDLRSGGAVVPANAIATFRVHDVEPGRMPGWYLRAVAPRDRVSLVPDVLVPIGAPDGGLPTDLRSGDSLKLWMDVNIPRGAAPGTYSGSIEVLAGDKLLASVSVGLTVWPFVLPDLGDVVLFAELDHQSLFAHHATIDGRPALIAKHWDGHPAAAELDGLLAGTMRLLQSHKITPLLPALTPVASVDADGRVDVQWDDYDRVVSPYLDGRRFSDRQPLPLWRIPFNEDFPTPPEYGAMLSAKYSGVARQYLGSCAEHAGARGWLERSFVELPHVKAGAADAYAAASHFGQITRLADTRLQRLAPLFPQDMAGYGWDGFGWEDVSQHVDIWSPPAQFFDDREMQQERMRGRRVFWALDRPPFSGSISLWASPADTRVIGWQAHSYRAEAVAMGPANRWPAAERSPAEPQACCADGSAPLIYPGRFCGLAQPIPSMRLKRLRRSQQDVAYLKLLTDRGLEHIGAALAESLAPRAAADAYGAHFADGRKDGWAPGSAVWSSARRIMADEINRSLSHGEVTPASASPDDLANTVQWRRFMESTRRLEVTVNGARVRPFGPPSEGRMEVTVSVTVTNRTRVPISGTLVFEELPLAWQADPLEVSLDELAPERSRRLTLRAIADAMETDAGAVRYLPIALRCSDQQVHRFAARLAYLAANPVRRPLEIDGDLSDWPSAVGNVAEDFLLITGESPEATGRPQDRATRPTQCFVAADRQAVYFGFNCALGDGAKLPPGQRNYVRYEDGIPIGDELIEILLCPDNTGTRSPGDLYHIVVKPYGSFWEQGIGADPQVGAHREWAANVQTAVRMKRDSWVAEVRVPLEALAARRGPRAVWGVNFTRFDLSAQEFSNWSGAAHNAYDPLAAGNLALP